MADGAIVPLLYEGRLVEIEQNKTAIDVWFERHTEGLTPAQKADLKRKYARAEMLNKADQVIYMRAFDISAHFRQNWQGTGFKAQLVAPSKVAALKYKAFLEDIGEVTSEVIISAPDEREGFDDVDDDESTDEVVAFWQRMMKRYGDADAYETQIINAFKHGSDPEILIVVSKLLTGFDAPRNTVLFLTRGAKTHFESGRPVEEGAYLKPYKKLLVDITASKAGLDKALAFANDLFNALDSVGYRVVLAPQGEQFRRGQIDEIEKPRKRQGYYHSSLWSPCRPTVVYVGTVAIGLAVVEMSEEVLMRYVSGKYIRDADYVPPKTSRRYVDHTWTTSKELPCGRLRLIAYSPYWRASWLVSWQETKNSPLSHDLPSIVETIENAAIELVEKLKEADHQAEIARQERLAQEEKRRQEEDRRRVQQSIKDSKVHLGEIIQSWGSVMNVERFLMDVEERAKKLPEDEGHQLLERLKLARDFLGTQNPLDFFVSWKTPSERYQPLASRNTESTHEAEKDEDGGWPE